MKFGMKRMLGLGFMAALMGIGKSTSPSTPSDTLGDTGMPKGGAFGSPIFFGKSCRKKHTNKLKASHKAKLKRRKG